VRLLFLATRFPFPPERGDRLTNLQLLRAFSAKHRVTFACLTEGEDTAEGMAQLEALCERVITVPLPKARSWLQAWLGLCSSVPSQVSFYRSRRMREIIRGLLRDERYDAVIVHAIRGAPFVMGSGHPVMVMFQGDSVGIVLGRSIPFAPWWKRPGIRWERYRVDRYTVRCTRAFRETWMLSAQDQRDIVERGGVHVALVPHGVDERLFDVVPRPESAPRAVFLGNLSVPHNVDAARFAAREVLPLLRRARPDARLAIVGADATAEVAKLGELPGVDVLGRVPDLATVWERAHLLLAPLRFSTGIQNKVLEAMAAGVPVVTTPPVAQAIGAVAGEHLLTAETPADLAAAAAAVLGDPARSAAMAARAREHVRALFTWDLPVRRLERLVADYGGTASR
jgi:polysaccharide biosynthesis protein PslH